MYVHLAQMVYTIPKEVKYKAVSLLTVPKVHVDYWQRIYPVVHEN